MPDWHVLREARHRFCCLCCRGASGESGHAQPLPRAGARPRPSGGAHGDRRPSGGGREEEPMVTDSEGEIKPVQSSCTDAGPLPDKQPLPPDPVAPPSSPEPGPPFIDWIKDFLEKYMEIFACRSCIQEEPICMVPRADWARWALQQGERHSKCLLYASCFALCIAVAFAGFMGVRASAGAISSPVNRFIASLDDVGFDDSHTYVIENSMLKGTFLCMDDQGSMYVTTDPGSRWSRWKISFTGMDPIFSLEIANESVMKSSAFQNKWRLVQYGKEETNAIELVRVDNGIGPDGVYHEFTGQYIGVPSYTTPSSWISKSFFKDKVVEYLNALMFADYIKRFVEIHSDPDWPASQWRLMVLDDNFEVFYYVKPVVHYWAFGLVLFAGIILWMGILFCKMKCNPWSDTEEIIDRMASYYEEMFAWLPILFIFLVFIYWVVVMCRTRSIAPCVSHVMAIVGHDFGQYRTFVFAGGVLRYIPVSLGFVTLVYIVWHRKFDTDTFPRLVLCTWLGLHTAVHIVRLLLHPSCPPSRFQVGCSIQTHAEGQHTSDALRFFAVPALLWLFDVLFAACTRENWPDYTVPILVITTFVFVGSLILCMRIFYKLLETSHPRDDPTNVSTPFLLDSTGAFVWENFGIILALVGYMLEIEFARWAIPRYRWWFLAYTIFATLHSQIITDVLLVPLMGG